MSALLTTTMPYMKVVIDTLKEKGMRDDVHRPRRRRAAERGLRQGDRRGRLLPRRRGRCRDGPGARPGPPRSSRCVLSPTSLLDERGRVRGRATATGCSSSRAARSPARCSRSSGSTAGRTSTCAACRRSSTRRPTGSPPRSTPSSASSRGRYERVFVAYADCGTGGALDPVLERHGVERLPGDHCYGFLTGNDAWDALHDAEPATFYLTDFLARHFDAIVIARPGARPPSRAAALVLRQLPATRATSRRPTTRTSPRRAGGGRSASASTTSSAGPATASCFPSLTRFVGGARCAELTVIWWRDIPAQVTAKEGRDRAARSSRSASRRRSTQPRCGRASSAPTRTSRSGAASRAAAATTSRRRSPQEAEWLEAAYPDDMLERLVRASGGDA